MRRLLLAWALLGCARASESSDEPLPVTEPSVLAAPVARLPVLDHPGRVVVFDKGLSLVDLDGTRERVAPEDTIINGVPYSHGHTLLAWKSGNKVTAIPIAGGDPVDNDFHIEEHLVAVDDNGTAALLSGWDAQLEVSTAQLTDLRTGEGAGLPLPSHAMCPLPYLGDIAPDGREAIMPCLPCTCMADRKGCTMSLCRLQVEGHRHDVVRGPPGNHWAPTYTLDGRIVFETDAGDTSSGCTGTRELCRRDLVSVPIGDPAAAVRPMRVGALQAKFSRASDRMAVLVVDDPERRDCERWPCGSRTLVVIGESGETKVTATAAASLPRLSFSLDDRWIAFTEHEGEKHRARACPIDASEPCKELGSGVVTGWVRAREDAARLDPKLVFGCYRRVHPVGAATSDVLENTLAGLTLRFAPAALSLWIDDAQHGRVLAVTFPTRAELVAPDMIVLAIDTPPGLPDEAAPPEAGRLPIPRIDRRLGKLVLRRGEDGTLRTEEDFIRDAIIGVDDGPLALKRVDCPADAPP